MRHFYLPGLEQSSLVIFPVDELYAKLTGVTAISSWLCLHYIIGVSTILSLEYLPLYNGSGCHCIVGVSTIISWKCPPFYHGSVCHYIIFCMMLLVSIINLTWPFDLDIEHFRLLHWQASIFCSVFYFIFNLFPFLSVSFLFSVFHFSFFFFC